MDGGTSGEKWAVQGLKFTYFYIAALTNILAQLYNVGNLQITLTYVVFMAPLAAKFMTHHNIVSFRVASPPDPLTRGFAPGPHWGHSSQTPI